MKAVLTRVLSQDPTLEKGTSAYIDDILVNEDIMDAGCVVQHLLRCGLEGKTPECTATGTRVLGL